MKSPEDHIDDGLRDALRRRFDDFEVKPDASLGNHIFTKLKIWQKEMNFQRNWIISLGLAILLIGTLFYRSTHSSVAKDKRIVNKLNTRHIARSAKNDFKKIANLTQTPHAAIQTNQANPEKPVVRQKATGNINAGTTKSRYVAEPEKTVAPPQSTGEEAAEIEIIVHDDEAVEAPGERSKEDDIALLDNLPAHFGAGEMQIPEPQTPDITKSNGADHGWTILAGVTPVKTFQVLNVISNPGLIYRNFQFPSSASVETLGYKLNAGIAKNGVEFLLSYSHYQQSVRYEKAGNEFELVPEGANHAEIRRKFTSVHSERILRLVGIGVRKQFVPKTPAIRDFYATVGSELSTELTEGRSMFWLNAGIGRQVRLNRNTALQIGPYLEYGFNKLRNAEGAFHVKPYQVGLSVILKSKLNK